MLRGACAGLHGGWAQRSGAPLRENHTVHSCPVRHAQQSPQILRIFHTVESQHESRGWLTRIADKRREKIFNREELLRPDHGDHTLVRGRARKLRQLIARLLTDTHARLAAVGNESRKSFVVTLTSYDDVVKTASTCLECFRNRMHSIEDFHEG